MDNKFAKRIEEYLDSECSDYDLNYSWNWCGDCQRLEVEIRRDGRDEIAYLNFKYDEKKNQLLIELSEDSYYVTEEFEPSVKYFWMLVSPKLFF